MPDSLAAGLSDLTAKHIGTQGYEPQRTNNGLLVLTFTQPDLVKLGDLIKLSLLAFPIPKDSQNTVEVPYLNESRKFLGRPTFENISISVVDYVDSDTRKLIHLWRRKGYDPTTGKIGFARDYKVNGKTYLFAPNGTLERSYTLTGVAPASADGGEIDMGGDDTAKINLELTVDKATYDIT